jgi:hypothetical protein
MNYDTISAFEIVIYLSEDRNGSENRGLRMRKMHHSLSRIQPRASAGSLANQNAYRNAIVTTALQISAAEVRRCGSESRSKAVALRDLGLGTARLSSHDRSKY